MKDINSIGKDLTQDKKPQLITTSGPVSDRTVQQRDAYWTAQLAAELPVLNFPGYRNRQVVKTYRPVTIRCTFPDHIPAVAWSQGNRSKLFALLVAGVNILLQKYTRQYDIIIGTLSDNMGMPGNDDLAAHTLLIRSRMDKNTPVKQWLNQQQQILQDAYEHQQQLHAGTPEVFVILKEYTDLAAAPAGDICFSFSDAGALALEVTYNADACEQQIMEQLPGHYIQILSGMLADEDITVKDIGYLTKQETASLLVFGEAGTDNDTTATIIDLFQKQAAEKPGHTAVIAEGNTLTYQQLNERSDLLAHYLVHKGVHRNDRVFLCFNHAMDRSIIGMLGIMKTGATYVPVDSDLPAERIAYLVADTAAVFVVTNNIDAAVFADLPVQIINLDEPILDEPIEAPQPADHRKISPDDHAYIIYTSGTTGDPKGVMITHQNLSDYFYGLNKKTGIGQNRTSALMSTLATDLGNTVLFSALIYGNTLHLFSKDALRNAEYLHRYFNEHTIDCIKIVPTYWKSLELKGSFILPAKLIIFGGEELPADIVQKIRRLQPGIRIINHYGPTETTIGKLLYEIKADPPQSLIPIGKPFSGTTIYIVDEELELCAKGIWGELLIGGKGVFSGYLNNPSLTKEKCIENKFRGTKERLYRSGDLVRINAAGEIEFASRLDNQVKIQGYRIEPAGIAAIIARHAAVRQCYVGVMENEQGVKTLAAYLETREGYSEEALKEYLKNNFPAYMIPSFLIKVPALPMTSNGKINKQQLPAIEQLKATAGFEKPQDEIQQALIGILEEIFNRERISINDNFFVLGGDSIKSIQVVSRLRQRGYILHLKEIIKNPVIRDFAAQVKISAPVKPKEDLFSGTIPFSPIQLYFFENKRGDYNHYNQSVILYGKELREDYLSKTFDELVKYHDTLRIRYAEEGAGQWKQYYSNAFPAYVFTSVPYTDEASFYNKMNEQSRSLDIQQGPLIRLCLFKGVEQDRLLIVIHHLLADGVSFRILTEDLSSLYRKQAAGSGFELKHKSSSLKEWQTKLLEYAKQGTLAKEAAYWEQVDKSKFDRIRENSRSVPNTIADRKKRLLAFETSHTNDLLTKCYRKYNTEINEILVTALYLSLHEVFNLQKILMHMEGHGREDIGYELDVSGTLGWFTSIFPVYFDQITPGDPVAMLLRVKEHLNAVPGKGMGYGLLKYLQKQPLNVQPEITFNYLGDLSSGLNNYQEDAVFQQVKFNYQDASGLITFNDVLNFTGVIEQQQLCIYIHYNQLLFSEEEINMLSHSYKKHLLMIIDHIIQA
ncbi:non-ribosomal peptide synthetase [Chitinophaga sp. GbtcB8]|uniref:non-ribosomal peptide synthetase n=1 Tax=Chitinophaga sp. GbtcB8 TaxID=2824753 RepID=UPI001C2F417B|nr:non-ribosomal peptide synthetase [Chitinophaga sp. GbtcB8]